MTDAILKEAQLKIDKAIEVAKEDFATIRTGRANASMFNKISADYYGTQTPLNQMATFQTPEARMIIITPFDKGAIQAIEKAIRESDLGVNPSNDGGIIRVAIPQLTEERRREFIKVAKNKAEDARISMRNIRRNAKDALDKSKKMAQPVKMKSREPRRHLMRSQIKACTRSMMCLSIKNPNF